MRKLGSQKYIDISGWVADGTRVAGVCSKKITVCHMNDKVKDVMHVLSTSHRRIPVLDREGRVRGIISTIDIIRLLSDTGKGKRVSKEKGIEAGIRHVMNPHVIDIDMNMELPDALAFFKKHRKGAYPVTHSKKMFGIISEWDLVRQVRGRTGVKVSDIMIRRPIVAQESHALCDVTKMLSVGGFRKLPVVSKGILMGIVTPRDVLSYIHKNAIKGKLSEQRFPVKRLIRSSPVTISPGEDVYEAVKVMISRKIGGLPVVEDRQLVGIITERDIVDALVM